MLEIVVGNILFLTNIKKTKETNNFSDIGFIITKKCKIEISLNLCTKLTSYNETVEFFQNHFVESLQRCRYIVR